MYDYIKSVNFKSTVKIFWVLGKVFLLLKLTAFITIYGNKFGYLQTSIK